MTIPIILPFLMSSGLARHEQAAFFEQVFPAMLPVSAGPRMTFTALIAEQQVKRQSRIDEQLVGEAVRAAEFTKPEDLAPFPTLQQKFSVLSEAAKAKIFPPPTDSGPSRSRPARPESRQAPAEVR